MAATTSRPTRRRRTTPDASGSGVAGPTTAPGGETSTTVGRVTDGATVVVANASGIGGSAGAMTAALEGAGYALR